MYRNFEAEQRTRESKSLIRRVDVVDDGGGHHRTWGRRGFVRVAIVAAFGAQRADRSQVALTDFGRLGDAFEAGHLLVIGALEDHRALDELLERVDALTRERHVLDGRRVRVEQLEEERVDAHVLQEDRLVAHRTRPFGRAVVHFDETAEVEALRMHAPMATRRNHDSTSSDEIE